MRQLLLETSAAVLCSFAAMNVASAQTLAPGSVSVHLNGRVNWYAGVEGSSLDNINGEKTSTSSFLGYMRLYPGFDGVAANGLHYDAATQIRMNFASTATSETLFVFQAYGYLGIPTLGQVSFGQQNGPTVLFETGTFEGYNDGGWFGDLPLIILNNAQSVYPFVDEGFNQTSDKLVYLSPAIAGFQFAFGFTPNQTTSNSSPTVTSEPIGSPISGGLPKNLIDIDGQYTQKLRPVGIQIGSDLQYAAQVASTSQQTKDFPTPGAYKDMRIFPVERPRRLLASQLVVTLLEATSTKSAAMHSNCNPMAARRRSAGWLVPSIPRVRSPLERATLCSTRLATCRAVSTQLVALSLRPA